MDLASPIIDAELYDRLAERIGAPFTDSHELYQRIVELPFEFPKEMVFLFVGFLCYFSVDHDKGVLKLETATSNEYYAQSVTNYDFEQETFTVPLSATDNSMVQAALTGQPVSLTNWDEMRRPEVEAGIARLNQASSGIAYSVCMPVGKVGVLGFNFYQLKEMLPHESEEFVKQYTEVVTAFLNKAS